MSSLAPAQEFGTPNQSTTLRGTVAVVDMVGYSTIAKLLEENTSATSVAELNRQIQTFVTRALAELANQNRFRIVVKTGDGIIILFERADDAHYFARHVHLFARQHNDQRSEATAQRWFRIGIATGEVSETASNNRPSEYAGTAITNAVRLESAARAGEILIDTTSFALLSAESKQLYGPEETVNGKRSERFRAHRLRMGRHRSRPLTKLAPVLTRRTLISSSVAALAAGSLAVWLERPFAKPWMQPLPTKRFVALLGWPAPTDANSKPFLTSVIDIIVSELARAEAFDSNLYVTTQGTAVDLTTTDQIREAQQSLGANLILATSAVRTAGNIKIGLQVLESPLLPPIRSHTLNLSKADEGSLPKLAATAAAKLLDVKHYLPDDQRLRIGTSNSEARAFFLEAEELVKKPNDVGLEAAIARYQQAVAADQRYATAYAKLALAYFRFYFIHLDPSALNLTLANATTAINLDARSVEAHVALASALSRSGDEDGAFREFATALAIDPSSPRALIEQARLYASLNRWDRAEDTFARLLRVRPNLWLAHNELGVVFGQQAKYKEALAEYRTATMVQPSRALAFSNLGAVLLIEGEFPDAVEALQHSFDLKPSAEAAANLAAAFRAQGKPDLAIKNAVKATGLAPSNPLNWLELGDCYSLLEPTAQKAHEAYLRASKTQRQQIDNEPHNGPGLMVLALTSAKTGFTQACRTLIDKAQAYSANDIDSQFYKLRTLELLGDRLASLATCVSLHRRGATSFQFQLTPDLTALRDDPRFKQIIASL